MLNGKYVPLVKKGKPLANSTLQGKYGAAFLRKLGVPTVKHRTQELVQLPFNQFKYDKDFDNTVSEFLNDKTNKSKDVSKLQQLDSAIGNYLKSYQMIIPSGTQKDSVVFFEEIRHTLEQTLEDNLKELRSLKYSVGLEVIFKREVNATYEYTDPPIRFYTKQEAIFTAEDIDLSKQFSEINARIESFIQKGSQWRLSSLETLWLDIAEYKPLKGSSYIPLPDALKNKHAIVNIKNDDENCLRYCLRAALFPAKNNINKVSSYPTEDGLLFDGVESPTPVSQICKVEKLNNLAINVYGWENNKVIIHRISKQPNSIKRINILLIQDEEKVIMFGLKT